MECSDAAADFTAISETDSDSNDCEAIRRQADLATIAPAKCSAIQATKSTAITTANCSTIDSSAGPPKFSTIFEAVDSTDNGTHSKAVNTASIVFTYSNPNKEAYRQFTFKSTITSTFQSTDANTYEAAIRSPFFISEFCSHCSYGASDESDFHSNYRTFLASDHALSDGSFADVEADTNALRSTLINTQHITTKFTADCASFVIAYLHFLAQYNGLSDTNSQHDSSTNLKSNESTSGIYCNQYHPVHRYS